MNSRGLQPTTEYHGSVGVAFEGWMKDASSSLLLAMSTQLLAMARPRAVMILKCRPPGDAHPSPVITLSLPRSEEGHHITAVQWLVFTQWSVLALGTSQGSVLFFSTRGSLLLRQVFYSSPVLQLRVRRDIKLQSSGGLEELSIVYASAIVRIDMTDLQPLLQRCFHDTERRPRRGRFGAVASTFANTQKVAYQVWDISRNTGRVSACVDGIVSGIITLPLFESRQSEQRHFYAITVGSNNVFTVHRLIDDSSSSIAGIIMKTIVPAAWSTFTSLTRFFWQDAFEQKQPLEAKPQEFGRGQQL